MNGAGKRACIADVSRVLRVLSALLGHQKQVLVPYINGAVYLVLVARHPRRGSHTGPSHLCPFSSRLTYSSFLFCELLHCSLILQGYEETLQMRADQPENNRQLEFIIQQLHSGQLRPLLLNSSRFYFLWLSFTITIPSLSLYNSEGDETARKNGAGEATARNGADSDVELADDEFDDDAQTAWSRSSTSTKWCALRRVSAPASVF